MTLQNFYFFIYLWF